MNDVFKLQYRLVKEKLAQQPSSKQFDFSDIQIFGKFDLFCQRLVKLMDLFVTMQQFHKLASEKMEGLDDLLSTFHNIIKLFRSQQHDLLEYHNNRFDRNFVEFNMKLTDLESTLQIYINQSFENANSIELSLSLLKKYQNILTRDNLRNDLETKLSVIFQNYGLEVLHIEQIYEQYKQNPPLLRNIPTVANNISWARHLLRKIEIPMKRFEPHVQILASKESKRIIKM